MASKKRRNSKFKKTAIEWLKWISAIVPVGLFIYILYYYKQLDFLKKEKEVNTVTQVLDQKDSTQIVLRGIKAEDQIKIIENEWHLVGGIAIHNMTLENKSAHPVKSVELEFKYLSDIQEALTTKVMTLKKDLPPGQSTKVTNFSVGFVNNSAVGCDPKVISVRY